MSNSPDDSTLIGKGIDQSKVRRFSADEHQWIVYEVAVPPFDRRGGTHLIFESPEVVRRVRLFPSDWKTLTDTDLYALSIVTANLKDQQ